MWAVEVTSPPGWFDKSETGPPFFVADLVRCIEGGTAVDQTSCDKQRLPQSSHSREQGQGGDFVHGR